MVSSPVGARRQRGDLYLVGTRCFSSEIDVPATSKTAHRVKPVTATSRVRICANKVVACVRLRTLLPNIDTQDTRQFASAQQIVQFEGLAVAISCGFESPLRTIARYARSGAPGRLSHSTFGEDASVFVNESPLPHQDTRTPANAGVFCFCGPDRSRIDHERSGQGVLPLTFRAFKM
jgi:hypothetical protein